MLVLVFFLGDDKYMVECEKIREISPMVTLKKVPHSPDFFAGFFNYRGAVVPVIDLRQLIQESACEMRLSTRIILIDYINRDNLPDMFGFIAERVTEATKKSKEAFILPSVNFQETPYFSGFVMEGEKMIQCIDLNVLSRSFDFQQPFEFYHLPDDSLCD